MGVSSAGYRLPEPGNFAAEPFSSRLVEDALRFVRARLAIHLTEAPTSDVERMASVLAYQAGLAAEHTRLNLRAVGLGEAEMTWRTLAGIARMWSDHPDYREDFGRMIAEFPVPAATHARIRVQLGECDCEEEISRHRDALVPLAEWDLPRWKALREQDRLYATSLYEQLPQGEVAQVWHLISARRARRRRRPRL
ncbi:MULTISPECIES: hypothetical protein [unclassified Streptomyces]|uniref:hypothetical protein n=1 Tax=unclassified Streptomyces TaxID=2593676 RepID=UPI0033A3FD1C